MYFVLKYNTSGYKMQILLSSKPCFVAKYKYLPANASPAEYVFLGITPIVFHELF